MRGTGSSASSVDNPPMESGTVSATAACGSTPVPGTTAWRRLAVRGATVQALSLTIAVFLAVVGGRDDSFAIEWLYSALIGGSCWLAIDGGRAAIQSIGRGAGARAAPLESLPLRIVIVVAGTAIGYGVGSSIADALTGFRSPSLWANRSALMVSLAAAFGLTGYFTIKDALARERAAAEGARRLAAETQLRLLESQLEPHMLFNTLANLRALIAVDPPAAQAMLDRLIAFLRATLGGSLAGMQPLEAEFARIDDYLALMSIRMGRRLSVDLRLPDDLRAEPVPALLLQPLVENGIRHGLEPKVEGGRIVVEAMRSDDALVLSVRDTGVGLSAAEGVSTDNRSPGGFGVRQVRERLAVLYGAAATLELAAAPVRDGDGGTVAIVRMPARRPALPPGGSA